MSQSPNLPVRDFAHLLRYLPVVIVVAVGVAIIVLPDAALADTMKLRRGGEYQGTVTKLPESNGGFYEFKLDSGGLIKVNKSEVDKIVKPQASLAAYQAEVSRIKPRDVAGHLAMAKWCGVNKLRIQQEKHRRKVVELDPDHKETRLLLGYDWNVKLGKWVVKEEYLQSIGYVRVGKNMHLPLARQIVQSKKEFTAKQVKWKEDIKRWLTQLNNDRTFATAKASLDGIDDAAAIPILTARYFRIKPIRLSDSQRKLKSYLMELISSFDILSAKSFLVNEALSSPDDALQDEAELYLRQKHPEWTAKYLLSFLAGIAPQINGLISDRDVASEIRRINRAAVILRSLEVDPSEAILPLVNVLWVNRILPPLSPAQKKGLGGEIGFGSRGGGMGNGMQMGSEKPKARAGQFNNAEVRVTLIKLTNQRFDYVKGDWIGWYLSQTLPPVVDLRRIDD